MSETAASAGHSRGVPFLSAHLRGGYATCALDVSLSLFERWTVLFGVSGAGKSTVLRSLAGLETLSDASVLVDGEDVSHLPAHRRRIALVAQRPALFPHMTVLENVAFSQAAAGPGAREAAEALLEQFHAGRLRDRKPGQISGGEQQRIAIARAVASKPRLLLLDEPFNGLELAMRTDLIRALQEWQGRTGTPILSVTHDVAEALTCADEVLRLEAGSIAARGTAREMLEMERRTVLRQLGPA